MEWTKCFEVGPHILSQLCKNKSVLNARILCFVKLELFFKFIQTTVLMRKETLNKKVSSVQLHEVYGKSNRIYQL